MVFRSATPGPYELDKSSRNVDQVVRPTGLVDPELEVRPATTQVDNLMSEIRERTAVHERVLVTTLTKRMAEDLSDYLSEHQIRVRYLHSDIDTLERVEILRDLRLGTFDVLIGINLLREGLDLPEVSLVAILDADKEGFLRSTRSLIQTMGRAARNVNGKAILYADTVTGSMERAMNETERRRRKQSDWNRAHNITPKTIQKDVQEMIDGVARDTGKPKQKWLQEDYALFSTDGESHIAESPAKLSRKLKALEKQMYQHARDLEFEEAAVVRDEILTLKKQHFGDAAMIQAAAAVG